MRTKKPRYNTVLVRTKWLKSSWHSVNSTFRWKRRHLLIDYLRETRLWFHAVNSIHVVHSWRSPSPRPSCMSSLASMWVVLYDGIHVVSQLLDEYIVLVCGHILAIVFCFSHLSPFPLTRGRKLIELILFMNMFADTACVFTVSVLGDFAGISFAIYSR